MTSHLAFKRGARIPKGVTPEQVIAELDDIEELYGAKSPAVAADAVLKDPERFPALRSFGPADEAEAFREAIRDAVARAVRSIVIIRDEMPNVEVRHIFIVRNDDGEDEFQTLELIASDERRRLDLVTELAAESDTFARKQRNVLEEIRRLLGG